jgi:hypothetical protein
MKRSLNGFMNLHGLAPSVKSIEKNLLRLRVSFVGVSSQFL